MKSLVALALLFAAPSAFAASFYSDFWKPVPYRLVKGAGCPATATVQYDQERGLSVPEFNLYARSQSVISMNFTSESWAEQFGRKGFPFHGHNLVTARSLGKIACSETAYRCSPNDMVSLQRAYSLSLSEGGNQLVIDELATAALPGFFSNEILSKEIKHCSYSGPRAAK
ncbi:MAG: hypothetical protein ACXVBE_16255 [Bdellovibrionota bacterium]